MNQKLFNQHKDAVREAVASFVQTLLGAETPLVVDAPVPTDGSTVGAEAAAYLTLRTPAGYSIMIDAGVLPVLSQPMLGEAIEVGDEGYEDLVRELAAQAYGTVRTALSGAGIKLDEVQFEVLAPGEVLDASEFAEDLVQIPFTLEAGGRKLGGFAVFEASAEPAPEPQPAAQPAAAQAAPPSGAPAGMPPGVPPAGAPGAPPQGAFTMPPPQAGPAVDVARPAFPDLGHERLGHGDNLSGNFGLLSDVEMEVTVELGRRRLPLAELLRLTTGSVIELEKLVGEPLEMYANGRLIAEGEAVVIDEQFGIRVTSLASNRRERPARVF